MTAMGLGTAPGARGEKGALVAGVVVEARGERGASVAGVVVEARGAEGSGVEGRGVEGRGGHWSAPVIPGSTGGSVEGHIRRRTMARSSRAMTAMGPGTAAAARGEKGALVAGVGVEARGVGGERR